MVYNLSNLFNWFINCIIYFFIKKEKVSKKLATRSYEKNIVRLTTQIHDTRRQHTEIKSRLEEADSDTLNSSLDLSGYVTLCFFIFSV